MAMEMNPAAGPSKGRDMELDIRTKDKRGKVRNGPFAPAIAALLANIEGVTEGKSFSIIKDGNSTRVGVIKGKDFSLPFDLLIKRFNCRGRLHSLAKRLTGTRARRLYEVSLEFFKKGLSIPQPVGFVEDAGTRRAFYISRYMDGVANLGILCKKGLLKGEVNLFSALGRAIAKWHTAGAVHGDLKWSNILVQRDGTGWRFFLIDLDSASLHRRPSIEGIKKDLVRFYRYGIELGAGYVVDREFLPSYISSVAEGVRGAIDLAGIRARAEKEFAGKRMR